MYKNFMDVEPNNVKRDTNIFTDELTLSFYNLKNNVKSIYEMHFEAQKVGKAFFKKESVPYFVNYLEFNTQGLLILKKELSPEGNVISETKYLYNNFFSVVEEIHIDLKNEYKSYCNKYTYINNSKHPIQITSFDYRDRIVYYWSYVLSNEGLAEQKTLVIINDNFKEFRKYVWASTYDSSGLLIEDELIKHWEEYPHKTNGLAFQFYYSENGKLLEWNCSSDDGMHSLVKYDLDDWDNQISIKQSDIWFDDIYQVSIVCIAEKHMPSNTLSTNVPLIFIEKKFHYLIDTCGNWTTKTCTGFYNSSMIAERSICYY